MNVRLAVSALVLALSACAPSPVAMSGPAPSSSAPAGAVSGLVIKVTDGDTIHVRTDDGRVLDTRVLGEDSPEVVKPRTPVQCGGPEASAEAHRVLDGQRVTLRSDPTQAKLDRYGRSLFYVTLPSGGDLSLHMVAGG